MMIADSIRDERYAGHMVSHKTAYVDNEGRKQVILPKEQWIIVRNTHEGIVTDEEFALANSKMKKVSRTREYKGVDKGAFSVFVCPYCGLRLHAPSSNNRLFCSTGRIRPESPCAGVSIDKTLAEETLLELVRKQAEVMIDAEVKLKRRQAESETEIKQKNKERDRLRRIIAGYGQQQISLYEKYKSGELSKDVYLERKAEIKKAQSDAEEQVAEIDKDTEVSEALSDGAPELPVKGYIDISKYDKRIMASLIEKTEVFEGDVLQVTWKHQDEYEKLLKLTS